MSTVYMTPRRALVIAARRVAIVRANHFSSLKDITAADEVLYEKARGFVRAEDARRAKELARLAMG